MQKIRQAVTEIWVPIVWLLPLRWRHNGCDSVSNHQPHHCLLNRLFRRRSKKTSKLRVTGLCAGNSRTNGQLRGKCFHLMTSSCRPPARTVTALALQPEGLRNKKCICIFFHSSTLWWHRKLKSLPIANTVGPFFQITPEISRFQHHKRYEFPWLKNTQTRRQWLIWLYTEPDYFISTEMDYFIPADYHGLFYPAPLHPCTLHRSDTLGTYSKTSNRSRTLVCNKIVDNSDVVGASPVGAAPTTSSFST